MAEAGMARAIPHVADSLMTSGMSADPVEVADSLTSGTIADPAGVADSLTIGTIADPVTESARAHSYYSS